jgi:hypothetical protein
MIADLSRIVEDSTARLDQMSHQEILETFLRMSAITRRFLAVVNYRGNPTLSLFPRYLLSSSSSASTGRSHAAPSSSSRPPLYPMRPPVHPPFKMSLLGGPPLRGPAPTHAPAPGGTWSTPRGPSPAPVPSSSLGPALQPGIDHYSIILDCIN